MIRAVLQRKIGQPNGIQSSLQMILSPLRRLKVTNISSDFGVSEDEYEAQKDEIQISQADENIVK